MRSHLHTVTIRLYKPSMYMENVSLWIKIIIGTMHRPCPCYHMFELGLVIHVAAEPYAYSYVVTCTLLHVAKIIQ